METISLKPINILFCNRNKAMGLTGHCHHATVKFEFQTIGSVGFPSFKNTFEEVENHLLSLKLKGFEGTNEDLIRYIHQEMYYFHYLQTSSYKCLFRLYKTTIKILGVHDENNHAAGVTTYKITSKKFTPEEGVMIQLWNEEQGERVYQIPKSDYVKELDELLNPK